jgi:tripartite ATP-independent transporter DctM subunit
MTLILLFAIFAVLVAIEVPVGFAMALAAIGVIVLDQPVPLTIVVQRMASGLDSFPILAIPLFILAGHLLNRAGIADRIFQFAAALVGHIRGGLAHVNVVASMIFAGMSGVAQADAAGLGVVEVKAMKEEGFDVSFAAAVSAASAIIGPIIPPSVIMVIYAVTVQVSVAELFLAGILPGVLMGLCLMGMIYFLVATGRVTAPQHKRATLPHLGRTFLRALPALMAPVILTVGILAGAATPTELGAITVVYAIILGFIHRELTWKDVLTAATDTLVTFGVLAFIIACAVPFGWLVAVTEMPQALADFLFSLTDNKYVILALINVMLLIVGCFMETTAILLIATPTLFPLIKAIGIDPVHFGLIMIMNLLIGALTPPFGIILFIMMDIARISFAAMVRAVLPFYVPLFVTLLIVTYWEDFVLAVPRFFAG